MARGWAPLGHGASDGGTIIFGGIDLYSDWDFVIKIKHKQMYYNKFTKMSAILG